MKEDLEHSESFQNFLCLIRSKSTKESSLYREESVMYRLYGKISFFVSSFLQGKQISIKTYAELM